MPQFESIFFSSQIFWLVISFFALWAIIYWKVTPVFQRTSRQRTESLESLINEAKSIQGQAESILRSNQYSLDQARNQAQKIVKETIVTTQQQIHDCLQKSVSAYQMQMNDLQKQILAKENALKHQMINTAPQLVELLMRRCAGNPISDTEITTNDERR